MDVDSFVHVDRRIAIENPPFCLPCATCRLRRVSAASRDAGNLEYLITEQNRTIERLKVHCARSFARFAQNNASGKRVAQVASGKWRLAELFVCPSERKSERYIVETTT